MEDITHWLSKVNQADPEAVRAVWERYFPQLVRLARAKLGDLPRRCADEEDVALSALDSFFRGAAAGRFTLSDSDDLWRLLVTITVRKAAAQRSRETAQKRGGGKVLGESALDAQGEMARGAWEILCHEPTPEQAVQMAETCRLMFESLGDDVLQSIAQERLEGFTIREIASRLQVSEQTVHRKLKLIRRKWSEHAESHNTQA